jgi:hypothetical protein
MLNEKIRFTYLTGKLTATLILPMEVAKKHGLTKASDITVEETSEGLLIKKI